MDERKLSDEDVKAVAKELLAQIRNEFIQDLGTGFWAFLKRGIFLLLVAIAAYGAYKGVNFK